MLNFMISSYYLQFFCHIFTNNSESPASRVLFSTSASDYVTQNVPCCLNIYELIESRDHSRCSRSKLTFTVIELTILNATSFRWNSQKSELNPGIEERRSVKTWLIISGCRHAHAGKAESRAVTFLIKDCKYH